MNSNEYSELLQMIVDLRSEFVQYQGAMSGKIADLYEAMAEQGKLVLALQKAHLETQRRYSELLEATQRLSDARVLGTDSPPDDLVQ